MGFKKGLWRIQFKSYLPIIEEIEFTFFFRLRPLSGFLTEGILQLYTTYIKLGYCNAKWIFFGYNFGQGEVCCLYKSEVCVAGGIISFF